MLSLKDMLSTYVVGQKRTSKNKQFVFMNGEHVYKGPFNKGGRLKNVTDRKDFFIKWNTPHVVLPIEVIESDEGSFIVYPNIAKDYPLESEPYTEPNTGLSYNVLVRQGIVKLLHAIKDINIEESIPTLLLALVHAYILDVGDMNLSNILMDKHNGSVYIIDYDDTRTSDRDDEMFYFNRPPSKHLHTLWLNLVRPHYNTVISSLRELLELEPGISDKINRAIRLLNVDIPTNITDITTECGEETTTIVSNITEGNIGLMKFGGLFSGSLTYSGYTLDVMKSAVQKYVRRDIPEKALYSAFELYRMAEVPKGKAAQSNLYNRLAVICAEDIGPANLSLCVEIIDRLSKTERSPAELAAMIQLMCASEKTRLMSHIWRTYGTNEGRTYATSLGIPIDIQPTSEDEEYLVTYTSPYWLENDPEELKPYAELFLKRLSQRDYNCVTWLSYYMIVSEKHKIVPRLTKLVGRKGRDHPMMIIWLMLEPYLDSTVYNVLKDAYFTYSESRPFLMAAVVSALFNTSYEKHDISYSIELWSTCPVLGDLLESNYTLTLDDYVYDKHTLHGKKNGKDRKVFVNEGAKVEHQSELYWDETLHNVYMNS